MDECVYEDLYIEEYTWVHTISHKAGSLFSQSKHDNTYSWNPDVQMEFSWVHYNISCDNNQYLLSFFFAWIFVLFFIERNGAYI